MRILFVTIADSPHAFRWMEQLHGLGWDLHLMPVWQQMPPHRALRNVTIHDLFRHASLPATFGVAQSARFAWPFAQGRTKAQRVLERTTLGAMSYPARLARLIRRLRPDVVHTMEMQQAGYMMARARARFAVARHVPWIYSCWGNDIYQFADRLDHAARVREVIADCDYFIADCQRDVDLARQLGLRGEVLGVFPTGGGYDLAAIRQWRAPGAPSTRRVIAVKGYHDERRLGRGRALVALRALRRCVEAVRAYEIVVYAAADVVREEAMALVKDFGLRVTVLPTSPPDEILKLMGRSRVGIGLSVSDGMPNTMLEAMVMGAFPIQSDTISPREYLTDGENGFLVPAEDEVAVASALQRALADDDLVDRAADRNAILTGPLDRALVRARVLSAYDRVRLAAGNRALK